MSRVSLDSRINAIEFLIGRQLGQNATAKRAQVELAIDHARQAVSALHWLRDDPEAKALMAAQAGRGRGEGTAR